MEQNVYRALKESRRSVEIQRYRDRETESQPKNIFSSQQTFTSTVPKFNPFCENTNTAWRNA